MRTSGVYPVIDVTADGSGSTRVNVRLKVGGALSNTFLELTAHDRLTATAGGETKDLQPSGTVSYVATFRGEAAGPYVIAFHRGPDDTSATNTTVSLPPPFGLTLGAPALSRANGTLPLAWSPAGTGNIDVSLIGDCIDSVHRTIPDDGEATIAGDELHAHNAADACAVTLTMAREQSGELDPAFTEGGTVKASQVRAASFTTAP